MRLEKAYRAYNHEFTEEFDALGAGMDRFVDLSRDFIGVDAIKKNQQDASGMKLAYLVFTDDPASECFGNSAVYSDGNLIGITTNGAYGHRVNCSLAFAYVQPEFLHEDTELTVETTLGMRTARVKTNACAFSPDSTIEKVLTLTKY